MITSEGLLQAEQLAHDRGYDLYDYMAERSTSAEPEGQTVVLVPASDRVVRIDHNSQDVIEVQEKLSQIQKWMEKDNSRSQEGDLRDQRLAEIKAGQVILEAPQANASVLQWLLLKPLRWLAERVADHAIGAVIFAAVTILVSWLTTSR